MQKTEEYGKKIDVIGHTLASVNTIKDKTKLNVNTVRSTNEQSSTASFGAFTAVCLESIV